MFKKKVLLIFYMLLVIQLMFGCFSESSTDSGTTTISAPTGVTASDGTLLAGILLSWNAVSGAAYYNIYRSTSPSSGYINVGYVTSTYTSVLLRNTDTVNPISVGVTYYFIVTAVDSSDNESDYSSYDSGYTNMSSSQAAVKFINNVSGATLSIYSVVSTSEPLYNGTLANYGSPTYTGLAYGYYYPVYFSGGQYIDWYVRDTNLYYQFDDNISAAGYLFAAGDCHTLVWNGASTSYYYTYDYYTSKKSGDSIQSDFKEADSCAIQQPDGTFINVALPKTDR